MSIQATPTGLLGPAGIVPRSATDRRPRTGPGCSETGRRCTPVTFHVPIGSGSWLLPVVTGAWNRTRPSSSTVSELVRFDTMIFARVGPAVGDRVSQCDIRHDDLLLRGLPKVLADVQCLQQRRAGVEPLRECLERATVIQRRQLRLLNPCDVGLKRTCDVNLSQRVGNDQRFLSSLFSEPLRCDLVYTAPTRETSACLIGRDRSFEVRAGTTVDLTR